MPVILPQPTLSVPHVPPPLGVRVNPGHSLSERLHALWLFNDRGGLFLRDATGNDRFGDLQGTNIPIWDGRGLLFDNVDSQVNFGTRPSISGTVDFTITARIQKSTTDTAHIYAQRNGSFKGAFFVEVNPTSGTIRFLINDSGPLVDFNGTIAVNDGVPHTVSCLRRGATAFIYVDGRQDTTNGNADKTLDNTNTCHMGFNVRNSISPFDGVIYFAMLHTRALTDPEILGIHLNPYAVVAPTPRRLWVSPPEATERYQSRAIRQAGGYF